MNENIYFPIWSNLDFFQDKTKQPSLIKRIKLSLLMYKELIFDSGVYTMFCSENSSYAFDEPYNEHYEIPDSPIEESYLTGQLQGSNRTFPMVPVSKGKYFPVCFEHLINELGLNEEKFINFQSIELNENGKKVLQDVMRETKEYKKFIEGARFCQETILENFQKSLLVSQNLNTPILVDNSHSKLIDHINITNLKLELKIEVLNKVNILLKYKIPDFSVMDTERLLELREDKLFKKFRSKLIEINSVITSKNLNEIESSSIESLFMHEYLSEMKEFAPSEREVAINGSLGILGLLPAIGTAASVANIAYTGKEAKKVYEYNNSWIAFVMKYPE